MSAVCEIHITVWNAGRYADDVRQVALVPGLPSGTVTVDQHCLQVQGLSNSLALFVHFVHSEMLTT